ncbi:O-antigen ligase family protein [Puteibacter caeruleilacunae]|nr:O-antigen ligase family protein [Puteibacter caeruleilacunae]
MIDWQKHKVLLFYAASLFFLAMNAYFIVVRNSLAMNVMPIVLVVALLAVFRFHQLFFLVVALVPLSIPLVEFKPGFSFGVQLPTEPLLVGILVLFIIKAVADKGIDKKLVSHPVSLTIYFYLFWIFITSITSEMPMVSFKFLISKIWFIVGFYFMAALVFKLQQRYISTFVWLYALPFILVIIYATVRHASYGFWDKQASYVVVDPFFNDHTSYGAMLAMYIPFLIFFAFRKDRPLNKRIYSILVLGIFIVAVVLSHTRAAWVSLVGAFGVWAIIKLRLRFQKLFITSLVTLVVIILFQSQIVMYLERNSEESSANLTEHISSMTNITTDASNLERLNRWDCAITMFKEKPVFGFGPGTYMFKYAPYQITDNRTIISTNSGDVGNAHSEYLGPLSESGILGLLSVLLIVGTVIYTAIHAYTRAREREIKSLILAALIGLCTYYIHGFLNNFLDTDKASAPFWGFTAIIVVLDLYTKKVEPFTVNHQS